MTLVCIELSSDNKMLWVQRDKVLVRIDRAVALMSGGQIDFRLIESVFRSNIAGSKKLATEWVRERGGEGILIGPLAGTKRWERASELKWNLHQNGGERSDQRTGGWARAGGWAQ